MPSLHFATSTMAALLLSETGPLAGAVGVGYASVLGFALVYLGEHYVVDLLGGLALCGVVRLAEPLARPPLRAAGRLIGAARVLAWSLKPVIPEPRSRRLRARVEQTQIASLEAGSDEMPRVHMTRQRAIAFGVFRGIGRRLPVLRAAQAHRPQQDLDRIGHGAPAGSCSAVVCEMLSFAGYRGPVQNGLRSRRPFADRLAVELRDHDGRSRGDAPVRERRRRRRRLDDLGVAPLGDGAPHRRCANGRLHDAALRGLHARARGVRRRPVQRPAPRRRQLRDHDPAGDLRHRRRSSERCCSRACHGSPSGGCRRWRIAAGAARCSRAWTLRLPALVGNGVRGALEIIRSRDPLALGAIGWWAFDIATLWASFHAFGAAPPLAVIVMAYFLGMFGNLLPLPGGIGGVDGGMIGALIAFGVAGPLAVVAVLVYRGFAFWLPTIPGAVAYFQLRRRVASWADTPPNAFPGRESPPSPHAPDDRATLYKVKCARIDWSRERRCQPRERDHHRQRACRLHGRAVHRPCGAASARHRGLRLGRPAAADDGRRELPRLPRGRRRARR